MICAKTGALQNYYYFSRLPIRFSNQQLFYLLGQDIGTDSKALHVSTASPKIVLFCFTLDLESLEKNRVELSWYEGAIAALP